MPSSLGPVCSPSMPRRHRSPHGRRGSDRTASARRRVSDSRPIRGLGEEDGGRAVTAAALSV
eukprot:355846-Chlamydomonas_euryale.AAC.12